MRQSINLCLHHVCEYGEIEDEGLEQQAITQIMACLFVSLIDDSSLKRSQQEHIACIKFIFLFVCVFLPVWGSKEA